jgi:hypothetical protein
MLLAPGSGSLNAQVLTSRETSAEEIVESRASRVFAKSPFANDQDPAFEAVASIVVDVRLSAQAVDSALAALVPALHAARPSPAAITTTIVSQVLRVPKFFLMSLRS